MEDLMSIVHTFSCRLSGLHPYTSQIRKATRADEECVHPSWREPKPGHIRCLSDIVLSFSCVGTDAGASAASSRAGKPCSSSSTHGGSHRIRQVALPCFHLEAPRLHASAPELQPVGAGTRNIVLSGDLEIQQKNPHQPVRVPSSYRYRNGISRRLGRSTAAPGPRPDSSATGSTACRWRPQWRCQWLPPGARSELRPHP